MGSYCRSVVLLPNVEPKIWFLPFFHRWTVYQKISSLAFSGWFLLVTLLFPRIHTEYFLENHTGLLNCSLNAIMLFSTLNRHLLIFFLGEFKDLMQVSLLNTPGSREHSTLFTRSEATTVRKIVACNPGNRSQTHLKFGVSLPSRNFLPAFLRPLWSTSGYTLWTPRKHAMGTQTRWK